MKSVIPNLNPAYRVQEQIRQAIDAGDVEPGDRLASLREIATRFDVSLQTVRTAIKGLAEAGLVERRHGSGNYVCELPAPRDAREVYMLMPTTGHLFGELAQLVCSQIQFLGMKPVMGNLRDEGAEELIPRLVQQWRQTPPYAVIVTETSARLDAELVKLQARGTRVVCLLRGRRTLPATVPAVRVSEEESMELALDYLLAKGHRRIGMVLNRRAPMGGDPMERKRVHMHTDRILALGHGLRKRGIQKEGLTIYYCQPDPGPYNLGSFARANQEPMGAWLTGPKRPTALVATDYRLALAAEVGRQCGISIPGDMDAVGLGNTPWSYAYRLPSIDFQPSVLAQFIGDQLKQDSKLLNASSVDIAVTPELVIR